MSPVRTLAAAQLRADLRDPATGRATRGRVATTAIAYAFSGLVLALTLGDARPDAALFVASSFAMVLAAFGIVGSYDELMGRPKDNAWLVTLPASEAQHYGARLLGIAAYVALMAVSVALPIGVRTALTDGAGAAWAVGGLTAGAVVWTASAAVAVLWALTLALPQRALRPAVVAVRAALIGSLVMGYQWIGLSEGAPDAPWWPGAWIADAVSGQPTVGLALLTATVGGFLIAFGAVFPRRYFALQRALSDGARRAEAERPAARLSAFERALAGRGPSRAAYGFAAAAFQHDRLVRGRLGPAALLPLAFVLFGWLAGGLESVFVHGADALLGAPETQLHLSVLVILLFCAQTLVQTVQFSDHARAAWVLGTLPGASPRRLQLGAQRALLVRVLAPLHVLVAAGLALQMPALHATVHAFFWFAVAALVTRVQALCLRRRPFSRQADRFDTASRMAPLLVAIPVSVVVVLVQMLTFHSLAAATGTAAVLLVASTLVGAVAERLVTRERPRAVRAPRVATA